MKKGKVISMPATVEAQIRAHARSFSIDKCYINHNWEDSKMAMLLVTRKHTNGNITFGFYEVDLMLFGVHDCYYEYNVKKKEYKEHFLNYISKELLECDYELVHNIIFEGVAFAQKYGFDPIEEFTQTGKYILEEESDDIPKIDIPLGNYGVPVIYIDSEDDMQHEIAILEKTAGQGNYIVYNYDDENDDYEDIFNEDDDDDFEEEDDEDSESTYQRFIREIHETGLENYIVDYEGNKNLTQDLALADVFYIHTLKDPHYGRYNHILDLILEDERLNYNFAALPGMDKYRDRMNDIAQNVENSHEAIIAAYGALVADNPDDPDLAMNYIFGLYDMEMLQEAERLTLYWHKRAPNYYGVRLIYAMWLTIQQRYDELFVLFGNFPGLDAITRKDVPFTERMILEFCACYTLAWLSRNEIEKAEPYYLMMHTIDEKSLLVFRAFIEMMNQKTKSINDIMLNHFMDFFPGKMK